METDRFSYFFYLKFKIFTLEPNKFREKCLQSFLKENKLCDKIKIIGKSVHDLNPKDVIDCRVRRIISFNLNF